MTTESNIVEMTLESDLNRVEVVEELARRVSATAGFDEDDQHKIEMAVHESVINAIWHGNKNDPSKQVWLRFQIFDDRLEIRVRDQGGGFDPGRVANPLAEENLLSVSGRGIFLIRTFMDEYRVKKIEGQGTEVTLVKRLNSNNSGQSRREGP
jgi:serine/threonine-protein kinase RsbW